MRGISVLLVNGSASVRRLLTDAFDGDARVTAVASAATASIALRKIPQLNPDVVLVDLDPPDHDPLAVVRAIRDRYPDLPVVMDSEQTHQRPDVGVAALAAGATRCVSRPADLTRPGQAARACTALLPVLLEVCGDRPPARAAIPCPPGRSPRPRPVEVLALGASTGGPDALQEVISALPGSLPVPVLVVQHMPAGFTHQLARRLDARSQLDVREACDGDPLRPGTVLIAPGGLHMRVDGGHAGPVVRLDGGTPENFCRPSVDVLFRSVAAQFGGAALAVVLTGMGADGMRGAGDLVRAGSEVLVQDEVTSTVWGMPGAVRNAGLASATLPLTDVGPAILERLRSAPGTERR